MVFFAYHAVHRAGKRLRSNENAVSTGSLSRTLEEVLRVARVYGNLAHRGR